jgi:hypothetical protein
MRSDEANCGRCGLVCPGGQECLTSRCVCPAPILGVPVRLTATADRDEGQLQLAATSTHVAAVWREQTDETLETYTIRFALLDATGARVGPEVILAGPTTGLLRWPDIVWTGTELGVVWLEGSAVSFQRLDAAGARLGSPIVVNPSSVSYVRIGWAPGSGYGLVLDDTSDGGYGEKFQSLGVDGSAPRAPIALPFLDSTVSTADLERDIAGAPDGRFGVLYRRQNLQIIDADGAITTTPTNLLPGGILQDARIAHDGTRWVVVAEDTIPVPLTRRIVLLRSDALSSPLVVYSTTDASIRDPAITFAGTVASVVFPRIVSGGTTQLWHARVSVPVSAAPSVISAATAITADANVASVDYARPHVAAISPTEAVVAWPDRRATQLDLYALGLSTQPCE